MNADPHAGAAGPIRVMLVEDHRTMLWGLQKLIDDERPRMAVAGTASTCADALDKSARLAPDVILLDLDLAGVCMIDFLPELLANGLSRALVLSCERNTDMLDLAVRRGTRGILHKEVAAEYVLKAIDAVHRGELWFDAETMARMFGQLLEARSGNKPEPVAKHASLTARERDIVHAAVEHSGSANRLVAQRLFISEHTLRNHLTSIYRKLDVTSRLEMYVYAIRHGLVQPDAVGEHRGPFTGRPG